MCPRDQSRDASPAGSSCSHEVPCQCGFVLGGIASTFLWAALAFQLGGEADEELADGRVGTPSGGGRASEDEQQMGKNWRRA